MSSLKPPIVLSLALLLTACGNNRRSDGPVGTTFEVTVENRSDESFLPTPLAPGVLVAHDDRLELVTPGAPDPGLGLEALAEDGRNGSLAASLRWQPGAFQVAETSGIPPGESRTFTIVARPQSGNLSLATMVVQSNDLFFAPGSAGIPLFDADGEPLPARDVTDALRLWDAGTEVDELPGGGLNQPFRQGGQDTGPAEGVVHRATHGTRALPAGSHVLQVDVTETAGTYTFDFENVSASRAGFSTPLAPMFWALHDGGFQLFSEGQPAPANGLEVLAEDGSPAQLLLAAGSDAAVSDSGATAAPAPPGGTFQVVVSPTATHSTLTLACMIVESNDVFLSVELDLFNGATPRPAADVAAEIAARLAAWDAGTEVNQAPGAGADQPLRQAAPNTGAGDPDPAVRRYDDTANDYAGSFATVTVSAGGTPGTFDLVLTNGSPRSYRALLTPVAYALHTEGTPFFGPGLPASVGIERLAEDGDASTLLNELGANGSVTGAGVQAIPSGSASPGPIASGQSYAFTVSADAGHPYLSLATMVVPSNDSFLALGPGGVALVDPVSGAARSAADVQADLNAALSVWDAGTEADQVAAAGTDQAPRQAGPDTGRSEGDGNVRIADGAAPTRFASS